MQEAAPDISVVIPVHNEEQSLPELLERLSATLEALGRPFEVVAIDDGSKDGSLAVLKDLRNRYAWLRIIRLRRNYGQNPAVFAGFAHARGNMVVMMDADLQNPPEEIPKLIAKLDEGYDVANGWREHRCDSAFRIWASRLINFIVARITGVHIHDYGCALKAFRREVIDDLGRLKHHSRYVPAEIACLGVRVGEVKVAHCERTTGESKYGLRLLFQVGFDLLTSLTTIPLQIIGLVGWLFAGAGFVIAIWIAAQTIVVGGFSQLGTVMALFFFLTGVQLIAVGFMCEYVSRIFIEVQDRPYYVIHEIIE